MAILGLLAQADAFRIPLPDESVHCVVTSPPYFGLRRYEGDQGDAPLGLESTIEEHIERTRQWAAEVFRVLRPDDVFWLNYADVYAGGGRGGAGGKMETNRGATNLPRGTDQLPPGSLLLMPARIALALQGDGWLVRIDRVWWKSNPFPEPVNGWRWQRERTKIDRSEHSKRHDIKSGYATMLEDASVHKGMSPEFLAEYEYGEDFELRRGSWRPTRSHEFVFMLTKKMQYWADLEAVREPHKPDTHNADPNATPGVQRYEGEKAQGYVEAGGRPHRVAGARAWAVGGRNPRSVVRLATSPYYGAHYATFPPDLIAPLIRATCPRWTCPVCWQGWSPVVDLVVGGPKRQKSKLEGELLSKGSGYADSAGQEWQDWKDENPAHLLGYRPTCEHEHTLDEALPGIVFDPFVGSGTTVMVARELLRSGIGIDLSRPYLDEQAKIRTKLGSPSASFDDLPLFSGQE